MENILLSLNEIIIRKYCLNVSIIYDAQEIVLETIKNNLVFVEHKEIICILELSLLCYCKVLILYVQV